jgi:hypothetical protein
MTAKITFFFEKRKHFLKKSFIRCPIFQFHTSIECKGYENRRIQPYLPTGIFSIRIRNNIKYSIMNIKNVMMMAAMMPAFALAETNSNCAPVSVEANDTRNIAVM